MPVAASTVVNAPASRIFDILADPRRHPEIDGSGSVAGSVDGPERLGLGSEFAMSMKQGASYKTRNRVVEFEPDRLIAWRHSSPHRWRYELEPAGEGATRVTETWDTSYLVAPLRLGFGLVLGKRTQRGMDATLVRLKELAERG